MNVFPTRTYWPTHTWRTASPSDLGADATYLTRLDQYARGIADMRSILIARSGYLLFEEYYQGAGPHNYHNINSITKSITSALVGIALQEGYLSSLDQHVLSFFPTYPLDDARKQDITLRHVLTMSSGYQEPSDDILTFLEDTTSTEKMLAPNAARARQGV